MPRLTGPIVAFALAAGTAQAADPPPAFSFRSIDGGAYDMAD